MAPNACQHCGRRFSARVAAVRNGSLDQMVIVLIPEKIGRGVPNNVNQILADSGKMPKPAYVCLPNYSHGIKGRSTTGETFVRDALKVVLPFFEVAGIR